MIHILPTRLQVKVRTFSSYLCPYHV